MAVYCYWVAPYVTVIIGIKVNRFRLKPIWIRCDYIVTTRVVYYLFIFVCLHFHFGDEVVLLMKKVENAHVLNCPDPKISSDEVKTLIGILILVGSQLMTSKMRWLMVHSALRRERFCANNTVSTCLWQHKAWIEWQHVEATATDEFVEIQFLGAFYNNTTGGVRLPTLDVTVVNSYPR